MKTSTPFSVEDPPAHLQKRVSLLQDRPVDDSEPYVLYWMHHAIRDHENPALDGCDPHSCGGILWFLGLFDRPFCPEQPVIGTLRARPLDLARYWPKVAPPASGALLEIAVIGAGLAGLAGLRPAGVLNDHGHRVTVYEREALPGGRLGGLPWRDAAVDSVAAQMLAAFYDYTGHPPVAPIQLQSRHWTGAAARNPLDQGCLWHRKERIGICGDGCARSRIEGAFWSGTAVAGRLLADAPAVSCAVA